LNSVLQGGIPAEKGAWDERLMETGRTGAGQA